MILLIDNFDSFAHNLARYLRRLGQETHVVRNDVIDEGKIRHMAPQAIVLSPGPGTPESAGDTLELVRTLHTEYPMLGVCLGHQTIAAALGAKVVRADQPMHGRTSTIQHDNSQLFEAIPSPFRACRYHSLVVEPDTVPPELQTTATTPEGTIMALEHRALPVVGVQFHPESILTSHGYRLLANFLRLVGIETDKSQQSLAESELNIPGQLHWTIPRQPVTF